MESRTWWWIGGGAVVLAIILFFVFSDGDSDGDTTTVPVAADTTTTTEAEGTTTTEAGATTTTAAPLIGEGRLVGMAFDVGGRGDKSFNDLAALAFDDGMAMYGYDGDELTPNEGGENREENLRLLAENGSELIIANGFAFAQNVWRVGTEFPDTMIAITDDCPVDDTFAPVEMDNVRCMLFAEEQGSYLMGVAAALKTTTGTVGFIGGVQTGLIEKFQAGFEAGVAATDADVTILPAVYLTQVPDFTGFTDPAKGKEAALALYEQGADVIFHAAGESGLGLFDAAVELNADSDVKLWAIGVDADQWESVGGDAQEFIMTSMLKRVDVHVGKSILDFLEGNFAPGAVRLDIESGGIGYATSGGHVDDIVTELDAAAAGIVDGSIVVPTEPAA